MFDSYKSIFGGKDNKKPKKVDEKKDPFYKRFNLKQSEEKIKEKIKKAKKLKEGDDDKTIVLMEKKETKKKDTSDKEITKSKHYNKEYGPFSKLRYIIKKDLLLLFRSKTSSLIVFLGPLLIIALVGLSFNTSSMYNIKIGSYSDSYSEMTESVIQNLNDQEYKVIKAISQTDCINGVKMGDYHVCVIFPANMNVNNDVTNEIIIYVDESRMNLAYLISNSIFSKISSKEEELSLSLTKDLVDTINYAKTELNNKDKIAGSLAERSGDDAIKVKNIREGFELLNLEYNMTDFNFTEIDKEMDDIEEHYNNTRIFSDLDEMILGLKGKVTEVVSNMEDAVLFRDTSATDLKKIETNLQGISSDAGLVNSAIVNVKKDIEGLKVTNPESIADPIKTKIEPITANKTHLTYLFPTLMVLMIMFISLLLSSTITIGEKVSKAYFRNFITPTSEFLFMISNYLTNIFLVGLQIGILFLVASYFFRDLIPVMGQLALVAFLLATLFILLGILIGYLFNSEETVALAALSLGSIMLFFSNTILPIETLPEYIKKIIVYNPFVMGEAMIKKIVLFDIGLAALQTEIIILGVASVVLFIGCFVARELTKRRI